MISESTKGVFIISVTPFADSGEIDYSSVDSLVEFYTDAGVCCSRAARYRTFTPFRGRYYTPYEGRRVGGWPIVKISRGEVVCSNGWVSGLPGRGAFLPCAVPETCRTP